MKNVTLWGRGQQILFPLRSSFLCQTTGFPWIDMQLTQTLRAESKADKLRKDFPVRNAQLSLGFVGKPGLSALPTSQTWWWAWSQCWGYLIPKKDEQCVLELWHLEALYSVLWAQCGKTLGCLERKKRAFFLCPSVLLKQNFEDKYCIHPSIFVPSWNTWHLQTSFANYAQDVNLSLTTMFSEQDPT